MDQPFEIRYDGETREGTAELFHWRYAGEPLRVLFFHSRDDYLRWRNGEPFRLINHWTKQAKPPNYRN